MWFQQDRENAQAALRSELEHGKKKGASQFRDFAVVRLRASYCPVFSVLVAGVWEAGTVVKAALCL